MAWRVTHVDWADQAREDDTSAERYGAAVVHLEREGRTASSRLELADTAAAGTNFDPEKVIEPFLDLNEVPEHLIVDSDGVARPA